MVTEISKRPHVQVGDIICNSHGLTAHKNVFDSYYLHAYSICRVVKISENGKVLTVKDIEDKENVNFALPNKEGKFSTLKGVEANMEEIGRAIKKDKIASAILDFLHHWFVILLIAALIIPVALNCWGIVSEYEIYGNPFFTMGIVLVVCFDLGIVAACFLSDYDGSVETMYEYLKRGKHHEE